MSSGVRTFVFTDLAGSASLTSRLGDEAADVVRRMDLQPAARCGGATGGRRSEPGDGLMVTFSDAADALDCAAAMEQATHRHNTRPGAEPLGLRVGAHVGPAIPDGADFFGHAVCAIGPPAGKCWCPTTCASSPARGRRSAAVARLDRAQGSSGSAESCECAASP